MQPARDYDHPHVVEATGGGCPQQARAVWESVRPEDNAKPWQFWVVGADIVYDGGSFVPLGNAISHLLAEQCEASVALAITDRGFGRDGPHAMDRFLEALPSELVADVLAADETTGVRIYIFRKPQKAEEA